MIHAAGLSNLNAAQKAELIYVQARDEMASRLWRAALGVDDAGAKAGEVKQTLPMSLESLLSLLDGQEKAAAALPTVPKPVVKADAAPPAPIEDRAGKEPDVARQRGELAGFSSSGSTSGYGPNARYAGMLGAAAARTGLPAAALATIVHAEAAKGPDGRWLPYSRNSRSSAAGLGQFLNATWRGEAERKGTWLNDVAQARGWLNHDGKVRASHRAELLALRYDPEASIQATADYAVANLNALRAAGLPIGESAEAVARTAYLGHHLGRGDAIRFLKGGLAPDRARMLLSAQIGSASANRKIAASDSATAAHRAWLLDYIGRNVKTARFSA